MLFAAPSRDGCNDAREGYLILLFTSFRLTVVKCMRSAGLPVEVMIEYLKQFQKGDETIQARMALLVEQREQLLAQKAAIESTLERLNFKISHYEQAMETGTLSWDRNVM